MRSVRTVVLGAAGVLAIAGLAACGDKDKAASGEKIAVTATDSACQVAKTELPAGAHTFAVSNKGGQTTEFYVYRADGSVAGEVENISPGITRDLHVELKAGEYQGTCKPGMKGDGIRTKITVTGQAQALAADPKLAAAVQSYHGYVSTEADALLAKTTEFVAAVKANDVAAAKNLYPVTRTHWERIEPVAESFGDLDPKIDARENDVEAGQQWTGFHKLEKDLWVAGDVSADGAVADQLLTDVRELVSKAKTVELSPVQLANGSKELLDEVASGKITGEEDRYSHTDLWDFAANVEGAKVAVDSLRDALNTRDAELLKTVDEKFAAVDAELTRHKAGEGWKSYPELNQADLKALSDAINAVAEPVSRVAAVVAK